MLVYLAAAFLFAQAPLPFGQSAPRNVHASGVGRVAVAPDIARVSIGVDVQDANLGRANAEATARMAKIRAAIGNAGVSSKDVRTTRYAVEVQRSFQPPNAGSVIGYRVINHVLVTARDLDRVGKLLELVVTAGANDVGDLTLDKEDQSVERARALERAVADARAKATVLAKAAGASVGEALQVGEVSNAAVPITVSRMRAAAESDVPTSTGDLELAATVDVIFAIR
jgi:hypothetical protein